MIKTLRITSIIVAVLAVGFFVFLAIFGFRSDEETEQFLNSPGAIDRFRQTRGDKAKGSESQVSPLVKQAEAFALYLNPPPKPPRAERTRRTDDGKVPEVHRPAVTPKFKLVATCVHESRPELSMVLIDKPGDGLDWVRQASTVGHLTIEEVKDGRVVVRGAKGTFELVAERAPTISLLMGSGSPPAPSGPKSAPVPVPDSGKVESPAQPAYSVPSATTLQQTSPEEQMEMARKFLAELQAMSGAGSDVTGPGRGAEAGDRTVSLPEAARISGEEAKKLDDLGKKLKDVEQDPNQPKSRKIERLKRRPRPRPPRN